MFSRLPLPLKILLWFFLNLALLLAAFGLLFNTDYRFDLDWVFAQHARQRVAALRDLIVADLDNRSPEEWDEVIERFADAYHVRLALFDDRGARLLGSVDDLPAAVRARLPIAANAANAAPAAREDLTPTARSLIRTTDPAVRYWLAVGARVDNPGLGNPMRLNVVAQSGTASMGGLILDPTPWLRLGAAAAVFSVLFWLPLLRGITRAIGEATSAAREIAAGRLDARVASRRRDELGALADAINQMAARLDGLLRGQKRFLGDVAHELCAPLARLQMTLGLLEQRAGDNRQRADVQSALSRAEQMARLVDELLVFSRASLGADARAARPQAAVPVLEAARAAAAQECPDPARVRLDIPLDLQVLADRDSLVRALANLLRNALHYGGEAGPVTVHAAAGAGGVAALRVADGGPGVPEADLPRLFDAFYRVDTARTRATGGVGLGLSIVKATAEAAGGTATARNRPGGGLEVTLTLPASPPAL